MSKIWSSFKNALIVSDKIITNHALYLHTELNEKQVLLSADHQDDIASEAARFAYFSASLKMARFFLDMAYHNKLFSDKNILDSSFKHGPNPDKLSQKLSDRDISFKPFHFKPAIQNMMALLPLLADNFSDLETPEIIIPQSESFHFPAAYDLIDISYKQAGNSVGIETIEHMASYKTACILRTKAADCKDDVSGQIYEDQLLLPEQFFTYNDFGKNKKDLELEQKNQVAEDVINWAEKLYDPLLATPRGSN